MRFWKVLAVLGVLGLFYVGHGLHTRDRVGTFGVLLLLIAAAGFFVQGAEAIGWVVFPIVFGVIGIGWGMERA